MTIPATSNWCPDCNEVCDGHPTMCTVCGATLTTPPPTTPATSTTPRIRPIPDSVTNHVRLSSSEIRDELVLLRAQMDEIRSEQEEMQQFLQSRRRPEWTHSFMGVPIRAEDVEFFYGTGAMGSVAASSATSTAVLNALPRIQFTSDNTIFQQCIFEFDVLETSSPNTQVSNKHTIPAIPGDFCKWSNMNSVSDEPAQHRLHMSNLTLVVADGPGTGEGGCLSNHTLQTIQTLTQVHRSRVILYMKRGGGLSFVQKAMLGQEAGASICLIGNHLPDGPWPYTMCDSTNEASTVGLTIPTVMISYAHGQLVQKWYKEQHDKHKFVTGTMIVQSKDHLECCICTEPYRSGCKMIQIQPGCGHFFHEDCVVQWFSQHNTCPFCRFALPFEDDDMEHRRLSQLNSAQSGNNASDDFYG